MSLKEPALTYRGDIRAIASRDNMLAWVTVHPQNVPTALYRLDAESLEMTEAALPCGALSVAMDEKGFWIGGDDAKLYCLTTKAKSPRAIGELPAPASKLVMLPENRIAALCDNQLVLLDRTKGKELQSIDLTDQASALAADPTGQWLAVGTVGGTVSVFDCEEKSEFLLSESEKLHEGAVTSLLFEPEELRFISAGADQKLLITHARGKLEPEDRGRGNHHKERVSAMVLVPGDRFVTGSRDKSCKSWTRAGATKPSTLADGVGKVVDMAVVSIHRRQHLAVACQDNSIRLFLLDTGGRFDSATHRITDAYGRAQRLLDRIDAAGRGEGLSELSDYDDHRSVEMMSAHVKSEKDHALRLRATELLAGSKCPLATKLLEPLLKHNDSAVRLAALSGLFDRSKPSADQAAQDELQPVRLALRAKRADVGVEAVNRLAKLASENEAAGEMLIEAISHDTPEVRLGAQLLLEKTIGSDSPDANLTALGSKQPDARTLALMRLFQRKMLSLPRVQAAIRRGGEDADAEVRRHAFLIALLSRNKLAAAVRWLDDDFHRQLFDLESFHIEPTKRKERSLPKAKKAKTQLDGEDLAPLLEAMSSRAIDTCLRGARCLALLGDPRALGVLLQLSREENAKTRGEVCQALATLGDSRATGRLETLLEDDAETVRDAAYTAYAKVTGDDPLRGPASGLACGHEDVRRRALQSLVAVVRKSKKIAADQRADPLLVRALNDSSSSVRSEAFKAILNMQWQGGGAETLRFALGSVHADIRREVLTELIAQDKQQWAWQLLLQRFSDPDPDIRSDAFEHAVAKTKKRDIAPILAGLQSTYSDIRLKATKNLISMSTAESQKALATVFNDGDREVRQLALGAIIDRDATELFAAAMSSKHDDVRIRAACARAAHGDPESRQPLVDVITQPEPEDREDQSRWQQKVIEALSGLGKLGDATTAEQITPLLEHRDASVRAAAADAMVLFLDASEGLQESFQQSLQHSDPGVKFRAALALAIAGDSTAMPVLFSKDAGKVLSRGSRLAAAIVYDDVGHSRLVADLDSSQPWVRNAALLTLLCRDLLRHDGSPSRAVACLSAGPSRVRLLAAQTVEVFGDSQGQRDRLLYLLNDRGDAAAWEITDVELDMLARLLVFGRSSVRFRVVQALEYLDQEKPDLWNLHWKLLRERFDDEIQQVAQQAEQIKLVKQQADSGRWKQVALGTYVALVRQQGVDQPSFGVTVIGIRQAALRRLLDFAQPDESYREAVVPVLIQALGDPHQAVRSQAMEHLGKLNVAADTRALAAIESGHIDMATEGMRLMTGDVDTDKARALLQEIIASRSDAIAAEAAELLAKTTDRVEAATAALRSPSRPLRLQAVAWLTAEYEQNPQAKKQLQAALDARDTRVRRQAAIGLADHKDPLAFDALVKMLDDAPSPAAAALMKLGDVRAADAAMDRIENDPQKTAKIDLLFQLVGSFRNTANVDRLLGMMQQADCRDHAARALLVIAGFDQPIEDPGDQWVDRTWEEKQHPRHDSVLAKLIARHLELESPRGKYIPLLPAARWSRSGAVDPVLASLANHPDDAVRRDAVESIGWRLRKRAEGEQDAKQQTALATTRSDALLAALQHRDPETKFLAAEGLALASRTNVQGPQATGRKEGITVLMSAIELLSDLGQRHRAVLALGETADPQSLDLLLRLAGDDAHALQNSAAKAIGHLGNTDEAEKILALLKRLTSASWPVATGALQGLRYLDTAGAWQFLRDQAQQLDGGLRDVAIEQLSYNDDPATKDLFLEILSGDQWHNGTVNAARRLFGADSLEPDYVLLNSDSQYDVEMDDEFHCLARVCDQGVAERIFDILSGCEEDVRQVLATSLLQRKPQPTDTAADALQSKAWQAVDVAAHIIGRSEDKKFVKPIAQALRFWTDRWNDLRERSTHTSQREEMRGAQQCLQRIAWAASRLCAGKSELLTLLETNQHVLSFAPVRVAAIEALGEMKLTKTDIAKLLPLTSDGTAAIRRKAAQLVASHDAANVSAAIDEALSDREMYQQVESTGVDVTSVLGSAASQIHHQPIVLPTLIKNQNVEVLAEVAANAEASETARLGAIEGLGRIITAQAQERLAEIAQSDSADEELRKAAWRSLRRSKRAMVAKV